MVLCFDYPQIKLFGLGAPLLARYAELFWRVFNEDTKLAWRRSTASLMWGLLGTASYYGCYAWVVLRTLSKEIGLGSMTLYLSIAYFAQFGHAFRSKPATYSASLLR